MAKFDPGMESMLDTFVFESGELLENLDEILMRTENDVLGEDDIAEIFRVMHTIKGSAAMMGLKNMSELAHKLEDIFFIIREKPDLEFDKGPLYELCYTASDNLKSEIENLSDDSIPLTDFSDFIEQLIEFSTYLKGVAEGGSAPKEAAPTHEVFAADEPADVSTIEVRFEENCLMPSLRAMVICNSLDGVAELYGTVPPDLEAETADDEIHSSGFFIKVKGDPAPALEIVKEALNVSSARVLEKEGAEAGPAASSDLGEGETEFLVKFDDSCMMPSIRAMVLINSVASVGDVVSTDPADLEDEAAEDVLKEKGFRIRMRIDQPSKAVELLKEGLNVASVEKLSSAKPAAPKAKPAPTAPVAPAVPAAPAAKPAAPKPAEAPKKQAPAPQHKDAQSSIISVKLEKLDHLLDLVAEIVITESGVISSPDLRGMESSLDRFSKSARELKKLTDELQDVVMSIRMVPVKTAFSKMSRVVRDMNKTLGKNVELIFVGEDTEADKTVVDILGDPLMHIVRNAVDHGIELPEERAAAGKTEPARVTLSAGYDNGEVVISCEDNGAGMDASALLAKAKKKGILTKPESEYSESDCFQLIMAAGFSTNETVTEYSGRGVGMDVVKKNIEKVGGKMLIDSVYGKGSKFTIRIPLSLSIIDVLDVTAGESDFSVPITSVSEIFRAEESQLIKDPDGTELVMLRDECLRVVRLTEAFELKGEKKPLCEGIMLRCREAGFDAVLFADELLADQQVVVKPLSPLLSKFDLKRRGLSGCSILADGSITLIADVGEIFSAAGVRRTAEGK
ncbi:MAG: chemotaxis protein CheA [Ruminococcus sp.]|nr:chemotaxis protein CheA [Ruminococcus sp.]